MTPTNISVSTVISLNYINFSNILNFHWLSENSAVINFVFSYQDCMALSDCEIAVLLLYVSLNCLEMKPTNMYWDKKGVMLTRDPLEKHISWYYEYVCKKHSFAFTFVLVIITKYQIISVHGFSKAWTVLHLLFDLV